MRRTVAVLFLLMAFGAFVGPFIWLLMKAALATGLTTGESSDDRAASV